MVEHRIYLDYHILLNTRILASKSRLRGWFIRGAIETELNPYNMNREDRSFHSLTERKCVVISKDGIVTPETILLYLTPRKRTDFSGTARIFSRGLAVREVAYRLIFNPFKNIFAGCHRAVGPYRVDKVKLSLCLMT
jgi:hypothetical protein